MLILKTDSQGLETFIQEAQRMLRESLANEEFMVFSRGIVASSPWENHEQLKVILEYARNNIRYQPDPVGIEMLTSPIRMMELIKTGKAFGDCDCIALFCTAVTRALGYESYIVLLDQENSGYNHAATEVLSDATGYFYYMDPTMAGPLSIVSGKPSESGNPISNSPGYVHKFEVPA
jgi:hypothetical protein